MSKIIYYNPPLIPKFITETLCDELKALGFICIVKPRYPEPTAYIMSLEEAKKLKRI